MHNIVGTIRKSDARLDRRSVHVRLEIVRACRIRLIGGVRRGSGCALYQSLQILGRHISSNSHDQKLSLDGRHYHCTTYQSILLLEQVH